MANNRVKLVLSFVVPVFLSALLLRFAVMFDIAYLNASGIPTFNKLDKLAESNLTTGTCKKRLFSSKLPQDANRLVVYDENILLFASGSFKYVFMYGNKAASVNANIYIYDVAQDKILPIKVSDFKTSIKFAPQGLFYSKETERLYVNNHLGRSIHTCIEVFSVVKEGNSTYPELKWLGKIHAGLKFGKVSDVVEFSDSEIFLSLWRSTPISLKGMGGDNSLFDRLSQMIAVLRLSSRMLYSTKFLYCRFDINRLGSIQNCVPANRQIRFGMANSLTIDKSSADHNVLYVSDLIDKRIEVFKMPKQIKLFSFYQHNALHNQIQHMDTIHLPHAMDRITFDPARKLITGGEIPVLYPYFQYMFSRSEVVVPTSMATINPKTKEINYISFQNGELLSAAVACVFPSATADSTIICGSPFDNGLLVCDLP